jgi:hypothetical protein
VTAGSLDCSIIWRDTVEVTKTAFDIDRQIKSR